MPLTTEQDELISDILAGFCEVIADAGPQGIPSSVLYACVCDKISQGTYQSLVAMMVKCDLIRREGWVLIAHSDVMAKREGSTVQ